MKGFSYNQGKEKNSEGPGPSTSRQASGELVKLAWPVSPSVA